MDIYLIRHATALALGEGGITEDAKRPLTKEGEAEARKLSGGLRSHGVRLDVLLTSPLLRARQTAEQLLQDWPKPAPELQVCDSLAPEGKRRKLARFLRDLGKDSVGLVGHQPDLGVLAAWLIGSRKAQIDLAKTGVAYIRCEGEPDKGTGTLVWLVTPEWLT